MEDHISFFASALFGLSWSLEVETCVYVEVLLFEEAIAASDSSQGVIQFRDGDAELSSFTIAVPGAGLVLCHSSVMSCDLEHC